MPREDKDVSDCVRDIIEGEGIKVRLKSTCINFEKRGDMIAAGVDCDEDDKEVVGTHVPPAVGRRPNTDDLGLDKAGVATNEQGYIIVDDHCRTNIPGIWAIGDCNGRGGFTHTSYNDYEIVAANLLDNDDRKLSDRIPAYNLYIDPPLGRIGMSEDEVRKSGRPALIGMRPMTKSVRAFEKGVYVGFHEGAGLTRIRNEFGGLITGHGLR